MTTGNDFGAAAFERALRLDDTASETAAERTERKGLEHRLAPLLGLLPDVRPSDGLFARIAAKIGAQPAPVGSHVMRATDGSWHPLCEGIETKTLWHNAEIGRKVMLVRIQPGAILPEHTHSGDEECMVLEGDMVVDGVSFGPGDFQVSLVNTRHPTITSRGGCVCMISVQLRAA
ncbi:MAG: cupin domain-containing protein [Paracoccaceae bacterium]